MSSLELRRSGNPCANLRNVSVFLGTLVRRRRSDIGLSQKDLAHEAKISPGYVAWIEKGQRNPSQEICKDIARALGLSMDEVLRAAGHWPEDAPIHLDPEELELIRLYRETRPDLRRVVVATLRSAAEQHQGEHGLRQVAEENPEYPAAPEPE